MNCRVCGERLNIGQFRRDKQYKSCPKCSTENGTEHVYYTYPNNFGITEKRASSIHPEGPQSYCVSCRGRGDTDEEVLCSEL